MQPWFAQLPYPAQKCVIDALKPFDTLAFALTADERCVQALQFLKNYQKAKEIFVDQKKQMIYVSFHNKRHDFRWYLNSAQKEVKPTDGQFRLVNHKHQTIVSHCGDLGTGMALIVQNLRSLFPAPLANVRLDLDKMEDPAKLIKGIECQQLHIRGKPTDKLALVDVLKEVSVSKKIVIKSNLGDLFRPSANMLKVDHLELTSAGGIVREDMFNLMCTDVKLGGVNLTPVDINAFLHHWLRSDNRTLRTLVIDAGDGLSWPAAWIIHALPTEFYAQGIRDRQYIMTRKPNGHPDQLINCANSWDITRRKDGLMASVVIEGTRIYFLVWYNRNEIGDKINWYRRKMREYSARTQANSQQMKTNQDKIFENQELIEQNIEYVSQHEHETSSSNPGLHRLVRLMIDDIVALMKETEELRRHIMRLVFENLRLSDETRKMIEQCERYISIM